MLKKMTNECKFTIQLESKGPWLIKDGRYEKNSFVGAMGISKDKKKDYPSAVFICADDWNIFKNAIEQKDYNGLTHYIPGTSMRGVLRSHAERIVRSLLDREDFHICCDPFDDNLGSKKLSCSNRLENKKSKTPYKDSCLICKLFGSTASGSRIEIEDASISKKKVIFRDGIGIDRFTGAVKDGANFKFQLLEDCKATIKMRIRNFELWQIGLLAYVFQDLEDEYLSIGFGTTKGFGKVKGAIKEITLTYFGKDNAQGEIKDVGSLYSADDKANYGFIPGNLGKKRYIAVIPVASLFRKDYKIEDVKQFMADVAPKWNEAFETVTKKEN